MSTIQKIQKSNVKKIEQKSVQLTVIPEHKCVFYYPLMILII